MGLKNEISQKLKNIYTSSIEWKEGENLPGKKNPWLRYGNGMKFTIAAFNIDIRDYTRKQRENRNKNIAKIIKAYAVTVGTVIRANGGKIIATSGDGILAVFIGNSKKDACDRAVQSALEIKYMLTIDENPDSLNCIFTSFQCPIDFGIGIDYGDVNVTRISLDTSESAPKDIIWVGECINRCVKLSDKCKANDNIGITESVRDNTSYDKDFMRNNNLNVYNIGAVYTTEKYMKLE